MSGKWPGGIISKTAPTVTGPTDGEGGSASGIWTLDQAADYEKQGLWPKPTIPRALLNWGSNYQGQLAQGTSGPAVPALSSPVQVGAFTNWSVVTIGHSHTATVNALGEVWCWGKNTDGQLGQGDSYPRPDYSSPVQVGALTNWSKVSAGGAWVAATKTDGTLWGWGYDAWGQLGIGAVASIASPAQVGVLTNWSKMGNGFGASHHIKADGTLWCWGLNTDGQLGDGTLVNKSSPVQIGALTDWLQVKGGGNGTTYAVKTDGTLWTWGDNNQGQLGDGTVIDKSSPIQIGALTDWQKVAGGYDHVLAIKTDGTLWGWGKNSQGQLGIGDTTARSSPVQIGALTNWSKISASNSSFGITTAGTWYSWGQAGDGRLGLNNTTSYSSPVQLGALTTWLDPAGCNGSSTFMSGFKQP